MSVQKLKARFASATEAVEQADGFSETDETPNDEPNEDTDEASPLD